MGMLLNIGIIDISQIALEINRRLLAATKSTIRMNSEIDPINITSGSRLFITLWYPFRMDNIERLDRTEELWRIYQPTGDHEAYEELYHLHAGWLMGDLKRRDHGDQCAEFAHSEAWMRVWTLKEKFGAADGRKFPKWLRTVARNLLGDCLQKKANLTDSLSGNYSNPDPNAPDPWDDLYEKVIEECFDEHGGEFVEIELMKLKKMTMTQIAKKLGLKSGAEASRHKNRLKKEAIAKIKACVEGKLK